MLRTIVTIIFLQILALETISAMKCYNCSSLTNSKCGSTFGYGKDDKELNAILIDCPGEFSACKKMENTDTHKAITIVERSCWEYNNNGSVKSEFFSCNDHSFGEVCYCRGDDDKPCNSQTRVTSTFSLFLFGLFPLGLFL